MTALFIAGAHTDIGKTHVACGLIAAARRAGISVGAFKPVVSGLDLDDWGPSDPGRLLTALGRPLSVAELEAIAPYRFAPALSPPMAARMAGVDLRLEGLVAACAAQVAEAKSDVLFVEGAGGVMSPVAEDGLCLDLMRALAIPVLIVTGSYLGAISHVLTAVEVVRGCGLEVRAVVVSESAGPGHPDLRQTAEAISAFSGVGVTVLRRDEPMDAVGARLLDELDLIP